MREPVRNAGTQIYVKMVISILLRGFCFRTWDGVGDTWTKHV